MTRRGVGTSVETFTGRFVDLLGPQPRDISLDDIAQGLALNNRFAGQISHGYCVVPESKILTADLRWVPAGDLKVGDELLAFDEEPEGTPVFNKRRRRKSRGSLVTQARGDVATIVRLDLSDGSSVRSSAAHPWLIAHDKSRNQFWMTAEDLLRDVSERRIKRSILRFVEPWKTATGWDAGYLAGLFDGEGSVSFRAGGMGDLGLCQKPGPVFERMCRGLDNMGVLYSISPKSSKKSTLDIKVLGKWYEKAAVIGSLRADRLNSKISSALMSGTLRSELQAKELVSIVGGEVEGLGEIAAISTTSKTYFADGFGAHNTVAEHAVFVRDLVIDWGHPALGMAALHHDSHEAYLGDWTSPLKVVVEQRAPGLFTELSGAIDAAVAHRFNFDVNEMHHLVVKKADEFALRREAATLKYSHGCGSHWQYDEAFEPLAGIGWSDSRAVREFMRAHNQEIQRRASFS